MKTIGKILVIYLALVVPALAGREPRIKKIKSPLTSTVYDDYLARVRAMNPPVPATTGSLWVDSGPLSLVAADYKARNPGDLLSIRLVDSFSATTSGENKQSRQFTTQSSIQSLFGKLASNNRLQNLLSANSSHGLDGKGRAA